MDNYYASSLSTHSPSTTLLKNNFPKYKNCRLNSTTTIFSSLKFDQPCTKRTPSFCSSDLSNENLSYLLSKTNASGRGNLSFLLSNRTSDSLVVRAVAENADNENAAIKSKWAATLQLGAMFGVWYSLNIYFNIYNKQVLKVFPYPATLTAVQFGCGTMMVLCMWGLNLYPRPKIKRSQVAPILILAFIHTIGNVLTNISLGKVAVSFTHTIKAMEPFFTVIFSVLFLSERPTLWVLSSLVPIVAGVALASSTEASFNWIGFSTAMASNVTNQSRNVLSKKFMIRKEDGMDNINLFSLIAILSFTLLVPIAIISEGVRFTPAYLQQYTTSQGLNLKDLCLKALLSGICFHSYQQVSYMILQMVTPMTHAVGNCLKRVVVIVSSVIFFQTPVSLVNSLGTGLALAGVFLYSRAKQMKPKKPKIV